MLDSETRYRNRQHQMESDILQVLNGKEMTADQLWEACYRSNARAFPEMFGEILVSLVERKRIKVTKFEPHRPGFVANDFRGIMSVFLTAA